MVVLERPVSLTDPDLSAQWECSADGDVRHFKCCRAAMKAHGRAMMAAWAGDATKPPIAMHSTENRTSVSKDLATGRLVMLAMLSATPRLVVDGVGKWQRQTFSISSSSGSLFTVLRDP